MSAPTGVAIIGSGIFAREQHLPSILATPKLSLKAIYSRSLKSVATLCEGVHQKIDWYSEETEEDGRGLDDMLSNTNIKAVIVVLPFTVQPEYIKKALLAGKHVLAEKPIAKDLATAKELLQWYRKSVDTSRVSWSVAENYRFIPSVTCAAEEARKLGRVLGFRANYNENIDAGDPSYETAWRKTPNYQGGFILDAGVHFVAAMRHILGPEHPLSNVAAFTAQLREHLPPVDTVNATLRTKTGISGTFAVSMGTTFKGSGFTMACEDGTVTSFRDRAVVTKGDQELTQDVPNEDGNVKVSVKREVAIWAENIETGVQDPRLRPEEALSDLEVIEMMLKSGAKDGASVELLHQ